MVGTALTPHITSHPAMFCSVLFFSHHILYTSHSVLYSPLGPVGILEGADGLLIVEARRADSRHHHSVSIAPQRVL